MPSSVARRLVIGVALVGLLALSLVFVSSYVRDNAIEQLQQRTHADLNRYVLTMRQKLARYRDIPQLLSSHPALLSLLRQPASDGLKESANHHLAEVNRVLGTRDTYLMDAQGMTVASSNSASESSFIGRNFSFRPYFKTAMQGELGQYFALGTTSKKRGFYFSYPLRFEALVIGVVVVKIDLNEIEQDWNEQETELLVSDEDGVIFIATRTDWKFRTLTSLHIEDIARIKASRRYAERELQALEVLRREPSYQRSEIITLATGRPVERTQYLVQSALVGNSDLNVSILADLAPVKRQVFNVLLFVTTLYLAVVLLVMVLLARARISRQRSQYEQREIQALERSEAKIKAVLDNTWAGLITLDDQGAIESMNRTAQILLGYKLTQLQGRRFSDVLRGDELEHYRQQLDPHYSGPSDQLLESVAVCSDGREIPVEFVVGTMRQAGALRYLITVQDITERKEYERELEQARQLLESRVEQRTADLTHANERLLREIKQHSKTQDELIQTAKLAVLGQLSAGINHELNQPLMAIRGYADNARQFLQLQQSARAESNLHEIALLTERMAKILHPLKEFSRKSSSEQSRVSVSALRQGVLAILAPRIEQSEAHLAWPAPDEERYVFGDLLRLEQVMVNLLSNALDAIEQRAGGNIAVSHHWSGDGQLQLRVRDSGGGIEDALLAKIFEPFYTTKGEGQGLGLGLSISARIVEDIGGKLYAQNIPGGAQFTLQLQTVDGRVAGQEWEIAENE